MRHSLTEKQLHTALMLSQIGNAKTARLYLQRSPAFQVSGSYSVLRSLRQQAQRPKDTLSAKKTGYYLAIQKRVNRLSLRQQMLFRGWLRESGIEQATEYLNSFNGVRCASNYAINRTVRRLGYGKENAAFKPELSRAAKHLQSIFDPSAHKEPVSFPGQWIGVEIECVLPRFEESSDSFRELRERIKKERLQNVTLVSDGSISAPEGFFAAELTVFYRRDNSAPLKKLCAFLNSLGAQVNKSCGLHVHLDCRDADTAQAGFRAKRLGNTLNVLTQLVPQSRLNNSYCKVGVSKLRGSRYYAVNRTAYNKHQTIEVRLHSGTTDFQKISHWAELLFKISRCRTYSRQRPADLDSLCEALELSDEATQHFLQRRELFTPSIGAVAQEEAG